jgi:CRP-like cAMP-binding protein
MAPGLFDYPGTPAADADAVLLRDGTDATWNLLREHADQRRYRPDEVVVAADDAERALWIVVDGTVNVISGRHLTDELGPGSVFGEAQFLAGVPATATVRAASDATLLRLSVDGFEVLAAKAPAVARHLLFELARVLALRLHALRRIVEH